VRDLASLADVSPGSASKLLPTLASEGIIDRTSAVPSWWYVAAP
jgi:DNA-binding IclR family transcriptional regulator